MSLTLITDARRVWHRLWSVRLALFWGCVSGLYGAWPAFQDVVPLPCFAGLSVALGGLIAVARVTRQPGLDE